MRTLLAALAVATLSVIALRATDRLRVAPARHTLHAAAPRPDPAPTRRAAPTRHAPEHRRRSRGQQKVETVGLWPVPPATPTELARRRSWIGALRALDGQRGGRAEALAEALEHATDPVARQNLIFLTVLTVPFDEARARLLAIAASGDAEDGEDVTCALAFSGDPAARARFAALARAPAAARVHRLIDHPLDADRLAALGTTEARRILRSYRCIEALDRDPYFDSIVVHARFDFLPHPAPGDELSRELLEGWLERYPGHPGSDDMALRLGRIATRAADHVAAARWYARAAALPDQRVTTRAVHRLVATAEQHLEHGDLDRLAHAEGLDTPSRRLLRYVHLRRTAAEHGFAAAVALVERHALAEPDAPLARAWRRAPEVRAPKGLDSGMAPLPKNDPLRRGSRGLGGHGPIGWTSLERRTGDARLDPPTEALELPVESLSCQFGAWRVMAELGRRTRAATGPARGDLLYKRAAVFFHAPWVLFPVYAAPTRTFRALVCVLREDLDADAADAAVDRFMRRSYAWSRAAELFARIERDAPDYPRLDKALFSRGLSIKKLLDDHPYQRLRAGPPEHARIRELVEAFEACANRFPTSDLAGPARRAATWWRLFAPGAFE